MIGKNLVKRNYIREFKVKIWKLFRLKSLLALITIITTVLIWGTTPALATINDDNYEGNIFVIYAGNGSLVPPRLSLVESFERQQPALLVFYLDDSSDCKQYAQIVSQIQSYYVNVLSFIPVGVDSIPVKSSYSPTEPGYYYEGFVPQTVLLDQNGQVVFDGKGQLPFESVDDALREVFDLLPRSESVQLKRRTFNEFNSELTEL